MIKLNNILYIKKKQIISFYAMIATIIWTKLIILHTKFVYAPVLSTLRGDFHMRRSNHQEYVVVSILLHMYLRLSFPGHIII